MNRVAERGLPFDVTGLTRIRYNIISKLPARVFNALMEQRLNHRFNHSLYGLKPDHSFNAQHPTVNDDLPNRVVCGSVVVKPNIKTITKTGVEFDDSTFEDDIDVIIFATGYTIGFPFIDNDVIEVKDNVINLYKYVFPPDLEHPTLGVIGCCQPRGAGMPLMELQSRLATAIFKVSSDEVGLVPFLYDSKLDDDFMFVYDRS